MNITVLGFGIARDIFNAGAINIILNESATVAELKQELEHHYPQLAKLNSYMVAVNNQYAGQDTSLKASDEVAIIPPVSGG